MSSARKVFFDVLRDRCDKVRGGRYWVKRGVINWASHDFAARPFAISLQADEFMLFGRLGGDESFGDFQDCQCTVEIASSIPGTRGMDEGGEVSIDDGLIDEFADDLEWVVRELIAATDPGGQPVAFSISLPKVRCVEFHDVGKGVQGLVVFIPVTY